tara:strand:+ start:399 stop:605 length:207 start_codon:yes stop_codon:yes gene_type:complete
MLEVKQDKKVNEYFVNLSVWDYVEATSEAEAIEILRDKVKHLHNEPIEVEVNARDIYNEKSEDYYLNY